MAPVVFGRRVAAGFAATVLSAVLIGSVSISAMRSVVNSRGPIAIAHSRDLADVERLRAYALREAAVYRGFLFTRDNLFLEDAGPASAEFLETLNGLKSRLSESPETEYLKRIEATYAAHHTALLGGVAKRKARVSFKLLSRYFETAIMPRFDDLEAALNQYSLYKNEAYEKARTDAQAGARRELHLIIFIAVTAIGMASVFAYVITKTLTGLYGQLRQAVAARDDLLAMASHDLKNPLTSLLMTCNLHLKYGGAGMSPRAGFEAVQRCGRQMRQLIDDLLDLSRITAGHLTLDLKFREPAAIVDEVVQVLKPTADAKDVLLTAHVADDLPFVRCDRNRVIQVFSNLIGNAIKFTPQGGKVEVSFTKATNDTAIFEVRDTGRGIDPQEIPRVFDRYWQSDKKSRGGSGLGLYISKNIVEAHGGRVWVESKRGVGSRFYVSFPLLASPLPGANGEGEPAEKERGAS